MAGVGHIFQSARRLAGAIPPQGMTSGARVFGARFPDIQQLRDLGYILFTPVLRGVASSDIGKLTATRLQFGGLFRRLNAMRAPARGHMPARGTQWAIRNHLRPAGPHRYSLQWAEDGKQYIVSLGDELGTNQGFTVWLRRADNPQGEIPNDTLQKISDWLVVLIKD